MISIRDFTMDDYDAAFALWENSKPGIGIGRSDEREQIARKLCYAPDLFLIAEQDQQLIGTVIGGYDGRRGIIYHLAVAQAHRRHGIGKRLMAEIEKRLAAKGCLKSYLLVMPDNLDVLGFYRELGWETMPVKLMGKTFNPEPKETC